MRGARIFRGCIAKMSGLYEGTERDFEDGYYVDGIIVLRK